MAKTIYDDLTLFSSIGALDGHSVVSKFGYNSDVDAAAREDIWVGGGTYVPPSDTGEAIRAVSTNAADLALDMVVSGLDANFARQTKTIQLNGTTPVDIPGIWTRVDRSFNGNGTDYLGTANVTNVAGTVNFAVVPPTDQQTNQLFMTIPAGHTGMIKLVGASLNKSGGPTSNAIVRIEIRTFGGVFRTVTRFGLRSDGTSVMVTENILPSPLPEKTDIKMSAEVSVNDSDVSAILQVFIVKDSVYKRS